MRRILIALAATTMLAACGSATANDREVASLSTSADGTTSDSTETGDAPATTAPTDPGEAALQFAKCMREHGVDMPDPQVSDDGGVMIAIGAPGAAPGEGPDPKDVDAANKACQHFMQDAAKNFDPPSDEDLKKMQEQALAFSKCMRDHGIDIPDPQFSADGGGFNVSIGGPGQAGSTDGPPFDPTSEEFKKASEACGQSGGGFVFSSATPAAAG